eukprot:TRINITY_DN15254_c0_g1_i1.p1 TRINITY_DN15254_c0_g1~~TRINITY_DN15254_c0_g1_i1.p1  ORF type:complete len:812 (-),score=189.45 TRINITY_DN15254_c0_g1_i1:248-2683(-)
MTSAPARRAGNDDSALKKMSFDVAHTLARLAWHEAWRASLVRAEKSLNGKQVDGLDKALELHRKRAKAEREAWSLIAAKWAEGPRGAREGGEVVSALQQMAKSAAEHAAAYRVYSTAAAQSGKALKKLIEKQREEQVEPWRRFEQGIETLKEHESVISSSLRQSATATIWSAAWHAANILGEKIDEIDEELEQEKEEEYDEDEEDDADDAEDDVEDEEDEDDDEKYFGEDYLGAGDDPIEDFSDMLSALRDCFWSDGKAKYVCGVRLDLADLTSSQAEAELQLIAAVPGPFGTSGLNCVRLALPDLVGSKDPLGEVGRASLKKAETLGLEVCLELSVKPGKKEETWVKALAGAVSSFPCVRSISLPETIAAPAEASGLLAALRDGGLQRQQCAVFLPFPGGKAADEEDEWTPAYAAMMRTDPAASGLGLLLQDGNILFEEIVSFPEDEPFPDMQSILDAASHYTDSCYASVITSVTLKPPECKKGAASKSKPASPPSQEWLTEFSQRLLGSLKDADRGFFFSSWLPIAEDPQDDPDKMGLKACLEKGLVDFSSEVQIIQPVGSAHKASLVYLHGFTCEGYSYMAEPEHFYRAKAKKAKKKKGTKGDDGDEEECQEYEPYQGMKVILPSAPVRNITAYGGDSEHSWHDYLTDNDGEMEDEISEEHVEEATRRIHALLDAEVAKVGARNVFLGGASQGCGVALHAALTYPGDLGAFVGTMGQLLKSSPVTPEWVARKVPVFVYNGLADTTMDWEKWVKDTWSRLEEAGADVRIQLDEGVDHAENEDNWLRHFLAEVLKPSTQKAVAKKKTGKK